MRPKKADTFKPKNAFDQVGHTLIDSGSDLPEESNLGMSHEGHAALSGAMLTSPPLPPNSAAALRGLVWSQGRPWSSVAKPSTASATP